MSLKVRQKTGALTPRRRAKDSLSGSRPEPGTINNHKNIKRMNKQDYKSLCERTVKEYNGLMQVILVYTDKIDDNQRPVFKTVEVIDCCKVRFMGREYWGLVAHDPKTDEVEWFNYNNCVSLEDFDVLRRLLDARFGWMRQINGLREETIVLAKAQLREAQS